MFLSTMPWKILIFNAYSVLWRGEEEPDGAVCVSVHCRELDQMSLEDPFQLKQHYASMIL